MNHWQESKKICVIGLGYVGLPTASILANRGFQVLGVDINETVVKTINQGQIHFHEPDLDVMVHGAIAAETLRAATKAEPSDIFVIAVPTPLGEEHQPDLSHVKSAAEQIAPYLRPENLVILESTSPVGTTEKLPLWLSQPDHKVHVAYCPERVLPGRILKELIENDRIVGGLNACCAEKAAAFYKTFTQGERLVTDARTAEMAKLAENAFRDVNIAYANELSLLCDRLQVDVWELIRLANHHPRVNILNPGPGVGGHCIAIDPWFLWSAASDISPLIGTAREVNDQKPDFVVHKIVQAAQKLKNPTVACFGLTFKANVEDVRESPALLIVEKLAQKNIGDILVADPYLKEIPSSIKNHTSVHLVSTETAFNEGDILVGLVDHKEFLDIRCHELKNKVVIDTRGMWEKCR
ncbi:MAG: UDP-N-acetyl-D-mannosamine dehydrogenase [Deltaproteobacteria bacterium]|nr:UDP-N-acetyl-D-mannosamine dehydrogenase [Deltaproteobacteria bacterium]